MANELCTIQIGEEKREYPEGLRCLSIAREYQTKYKSDIVLARFNKEVRELNDTVEYDGELEFITLSDREGKLVYRRGLTFLMEAAAFRVLKGYSIRVQHSISNGYYCEVFLDGKLIKPDEHMLDLLRGQMKKMVKQELPIEKIEVDTAQAVEFCSHWGDDDKEKMLRFQQNKALKVYILNNYFDYYYGPMLPSTSYLKYFELQLFENGFVLLFPTTYTKKIDAFQPYEKLFATMDETSHWGEMLGVRTVGLLNEKIAQGKVQELILVQEALMEEKIGRIAAEIASDRTKKFVMIAGPSSSGKTTFSHRLAIQLTAHGLRPHTISLDDFYKNREETPKDKNGEYDFEAFEALDIDLINDVLTRLLEGKEAQIPAFNFQTGRREYKGRKMCFGKDDVLVIEGIHGLNEKLSYKIAREAKFKIYISALTQLNLDYHNLVSTRDARLLRRMVRDARTRNTTARETLARWDSVRRGEEKNIFPFQEQADVMFNSALIYELSVLKLYAEPLLYQIDKSCPEYPQAQRLLNLLSHFLPVPGETIGHNSILREFIGGSCFNV